MLLSELQLAGIRAALATHGLRLRISPMVVQIRSRIPELADGLLDFYGDREIIATAGFADFHIGLDKPRGVRRWIRPQVEFAFDGLRPFKPLPQAQAYPMFEWGLNWCIAQYFHHVVTIHSAAIERAGHALIMPAPPGSGKSTLCAALVSRGWRLFSDELALVRPLDLHLIPVPRPISLKNASIDLIREFAPNHFVGKRYRDTHKGDLAHMKPTADSVARAGETAAPRWIIFPKYSPKAITTLTPVAKPQALVRLTECGFNYAKLGGSAFLVLNCLVDQCHTFEFTYSRLDEAISLFDGLTRG